MGTHDRHRGRLPEIHEDRDTITFVIAIGGGTGATAELVVRCEREGEMYASIRAVEPPRRQP